MDCQRVPMLVISHFTLFLLASFYSVDGRINKPHVKTIKTEYGDIYDCVNIHKQPALDHPLLKGHKIQMSPSFASASKTPSFTSSQVQMGLKEVCPAETVPIKRATQEELLRADSSFRQHFDDVVVGGSGFEFAGLSANAADKTKFHGAGAYISIYNPKAAHGQFTASVISIEGGPPDQFSTIRFGWMVNLNLYGDTHTRLYSIWGSQGVDGKMNGCYNTLCPGFVLLSSSTPPDLVFANLSIAGGPQVYVKLTVAQDKITGHWYLLYSQNDKEEDITIGYWPIDLLTNLKNGSEAIRWGGMVYSDTPQSPPMGSGGRDCRFRKIALSANHTNPPLEVAESRCYRVGDNSDKGGDEGYSFWVGGPGGDTQHCN